MLVYLFGPIHGTEPDDHGWRSKAKDALSGIATVYDPYLAFRSQDGGGKLNCVPPSPDAIITINESAMDNADIMLGILDRGSVGSAREVERAINRNIPVMAFCPHVSVYTQDHRIHHFPSIDAAIKDAVDLAAHYTDRRNNDIHNPVVSARGTVLGDRQSAFPPTPLPIIPTIDCCPVDPTAPYTLPHRSYPGDCGYDLYVSHDTEILPLSFADVPTNIRVALPPNVWGLIMGRSSAIRSRGLVVLPGILDNGYRGPLFTAVYNICAFDVLVEQGQRLGQLVLMPLVAATPQWVGWMPDTDRGSSGFGSTGQ